MLDLLGLPDSDENMMRHWSDRCSNFLFQPVAPDKEAMAKEQREILDAQQAYFMPLIEARRRAPGEDMISARHARKWPANAYPISKYLPPAT